MATAKQKETIQEKKIRRNKAVLQRYNVLKQTMKCRETYPILMNEYGLGESTVKSILFDKNYSNSPLTSSVADDADQTTCQEQ